MKAFKKKRGTFRVNIGVVKEIKDQENRVALTPAGAKVLVDNGHQVTVEKGAGAGSGFSDEEYKEVGAEIVDTAESAWKAELILKVKEPLSSEFQYFRKDQMIFTYLHLAKEEKLTKQLVKDEVTAIAYETVQLPDGSLPLLTPMSEVAGRMAPQIGAQFLEKTYGGRGVLLSGIPGVERGKVTIIGGGVVGTNAAKIAVGLGAEVTIIDLSPSRLRELDDLFGSSVQTLMSSPVNIANSLKTSDLVIGAVLIPGAKAPTLVTEEMIKGMPEGSVVIDVAIDQGGIFATSDRVTTHDSPTYEKHGVLHYAVSNIPGAAPRTATIGLTNVTLPYIAKIANQGLKEAATHDETLRKGLNTFGGFVTNQPVAETHQLSYKSPEEIWNL